MKTTSNGFKWIECECGIGGKNSPKCYIPKQDLINDVIENNKKSKYFKLTHLYTGNKLKVAIRASGILGKFILQVCNKIHACKQIVLMLTLLMPEWLFDPQK